MPEFDADAYLIDAVRAGDPQGWSTVIERYQGRLLSFARRMLADRSEAEDIVQETFVGLLRSLENYDTRRSLETYLFAILRNKLHDHFRKQRGGQRQSLDALELDDAAEAWLDPTSPDEQLAEREALAAQRTALVSALRGWVDACRQQQRFQELIVVEMLVVLGLRNKEVASDLELTETAVAGLKFRVLEQWRRLAQIEELGHTWSEADLSRDSTVGRIWREEGVSCLKRSTLGKYLLGALDEEWTGYVAFHAEEAGCARCAANLDDLRSEEARDAQYHAAFAQRCLQSSVGFLSQVSGR